MRAIEGIIDRRADRGAGRLYVSYVGSGFSRTFTGVRLKADTTYM
jgi:hypothetical protein